MSRISILLVDDEETFLEVSKIYLEKMNTNFQITTAISAIKALSLIDEQPFDVIISDYQMPNLNGLEFLSKLREVGNNIPFIIFTGKGREEVAIQALNLGADYYLQKGGKAISQFHELLNLIVKLIDKKQAEVARKHLLDQQLSINELALTLGETRDLNRIYKIIFQHIYSIMDADTFVVSFYNQDTNLISPGYALIKGNVLDITGFPAISINHIESQIQKRVIESGNSIYLSDLNKNNKKISNTSDYTKSAVYVPMKIGGETIGVIEVQSNRLNAYTQQDIDLLSALANVAAIAIQNARFLNIQQQANIELQNEKERSQKYLNLIEIIILVLDTNAIVKNINRKGCEILGVPETEVIGKHWFDNFILPDEKETSLSVFKQTITSQELESNRASTLITKDGSLKTISWKLNALTDNSSITGVLYSGYDITTQLKPEEVLAHNEFRFKQFAEIFQEGLAIIYNDTIIFVNDKICEIYGCTREEFMQSNFYDFIAPTEKDRITKILTNSFKTGKFPDEIVFWIYSRDGIIKCTRNHFITNFDGNATHNVIIRTIDITDQKLTEIALKASEQNYRIIFDSIIDPMHVVDRNLNFILINQSLIDWLSSLGIEKNIIGNSILKVFSFLPKEVEEEYKYVINTGEPIVTTESNIINNMIVTTETRKIPIFEGNKVVRVITIIRDITKERKIEQQLIDSELKLRRFFEKSSDGMIISDLNDTIININEKALVMFETNYDDILNKKITDFVYKKALKEFYIKKSTLLIDGNITFDISLASKTRTFQAEISANITTIGKEKYIQLIIRDVEERKIIEENRLKYINDLKFLSNTALDLISFSHSKDIYKYISDKILELIKDSIIIVLTYDEFTGHTIIQAVTLPDGYFKLFKKYFKNSLSGKKINLEPEDKEKIISGKFKRVNLDYLDFTKHFISKRRAKNLMTTLKVENIYTLPFMSGDIFLGAASVVMLNGKRLPSTELLETFINQASVALRWYNIQAELFNSEERYRSLVETMNDGLVIDDLNKLFIYVNPRLCEMLEYSAQDLLGKPVIDFIVGEEQQNYIKYSTEGTSQEHVNYEIHWLTKSGKKLPTLISPKIILDSEGKKVGSFAVITDISYIKKYEEKLKEQQMELQKQRDELESFAATIAHDLRGKMQIITLYNSMIEHEYSEKIAESIEDMSSFIENLLLLAKKGEILGELVHVDLKLLVTELCQNISSLNPDLQITIEDLPSIYGDQIRLNQVFENILINVVKHAKASSIRIYTKEDQDYHKIVVKDDGKGISTNKQKEIMNSWNGIRITSFGMLIIYRIIKAHKGEILLESKEGEGTKIILLFPK